MILASTKYHLIPSSIRTHFGDIHLFPLAYWAASEPYCQTSSLFHLWNTQVLVGKAWLFPNNRLHLLLQNHLSGISSTYTFKGLETATPFAEEMGRSNPHLPTPPQPRQQAELMATLFARL